MRAEGKIRTIGKRTEFYSDKTKQWHDLSQADMAHKTDAVSWWNSTGRQYGARSPEVRQWMKDSKNRYYVAVAQNPQPLRKPVKIHSEF